MPLELAVVEAQLSKDAASIHAVAQKIVDLRDRGVALLGTMMDFYRKFTADSHA